MKIKIDGRVEKELDRIAPIIRKTVIEKIYGLRNWPKVTQVERLKGGRWGVCYRKRIGDHRVLFQVVNDEIVVIKVGNRREVYE